MHERERHSIILKAVAERPVATVSEIVEWTGASEATVRRDIAALHLEGKLRRVRGGAEGLEQPLAASRSSAPAGRPFHLDLTVAAEAKRAIADRAVAMCRDGESIIVSGGTTTYQMVHGLAERRLSVLTNSFPIAEALIKGSHSTVTLTGGIVYRDQQIVLSPFEEDGGLRFHASRLFMGARGVGPMGAMEVDPLIARAGQRLIRQADEVVLLVTSDKLRARAPLVTCPLGNVATLITDTGIAEEERDMLERAGVAVQTVTVEAKAQG